MFGRCASRRASLCTFQRVISTRGGSFARARTRNPASRSRHPFTSASTNRIGSGWPIAQSITLPASPSLIQARPRTSRPADSMLADLRSTAKATSGSPTDLVAAYWAWPISWTWGYASSSMVLRRPPTKITSLWRIRPDLSETVERILTVLDSAATPQPQALDIPRYRLHPLKGELKGLWAVTVRANWRIIFRFEGTAGYDVELIDYH